MKDAINMNRRLTIREICDNLNLSFGTVQTILKKKLNMRKVAARWIPKLLNSDQKKSRVEAAKSFLNQYRTQGETFINRIVTVDETWISLFDPETKRA